MKNKIAIVGAGLVGNSLAKRLENYYDVILIEKVEDLPENSRVVLNQNEAEHLLDNRENGSISDSPLFLSALENLREIKEYYSFYRDDIPSKSFYQHIQDSRKYKKHRKRR